MFLGDLDAHVAQWVVHHPQTARVLESLQIDYCCRGARPLGEACRDRGLDPQRVLAELRAAISQPTNNEARRWDHLSLSGLCDHIEQTHHALLRRELPRLARLLQTAAAAHGERHPELHQVRRAFDTLRAELEPHMFKEERILFPAIRALEASATPPAFPFGSVAHPMGVMEHEHDAAGSALASIRELTGNYRVPSDGCPTYRALLDGLRCLEQDMHEHVHKENSILFPRARELEGVRLGAAV